MKFRATDVIISFSIRGSGAVIQRILGEFSLTIPDSVERATQWLVISIGAAILTIDDIVGLVAGIPTMAGLTRCRVDNLRLGCFILITGARICLSEIRSG